MATVSDFITDRLHEWGVRRIYGYPGDGSKRVERPEQIGPAWDEALAADHPVVIDALTDPEAPPLPPHITLEQAKALLSAIVKGDNTRGMIRQSFKDLADPLLPGRTEATQS